MKSDKKKCRKALQREVIQVLLFNKKQNQFKNIPKALLITIQIVKVFSTKHTNNFAPLLAINSAT